MAASKVNDTICAVSTAPGAGGIAVVRVSGPDAIAVCDRIWRGKPLEEARSHTARVGTLLDSNGEALDEAVALVFRGPHSFTGEDTVELSVHGSRWIQREALAALVSRGARIAEPGEFTRRAFASGRLDLAQAEAVADMIAASSRAAARVALKQMRGSISEKLDGLRKRLVDLASLLELELDFSEEDVEFASREKLVDATEAVVSEIKRLLGSYRSGAAIKDGIPVAIIGATNAGKSSLLNALLGEDRAIVSDIHGTTRDTIEDTLEIGDYLFRIIDTAGIRETSDKIERLGIERSREVLKRANIILHVIDPSAPEGDSPEIPEDAQILRIINKSDLGIGKDLDGIHISAKTGEGLEGLRQKIVECAARDIATGGEEDAVLITNARHAAALEAAAKSAQTLLDGLQTTLPSDLLAQDLRETLHHLATITGEISTTEILTNIFSHFCIGK
ncbi:MAG: tRNA uridine-5-carboxymethylaminomethyl(34) synthesis GTPase MnmE [Muribaculaceae bacterium]|nr:tRNA uridine-5-carboxymethylaminomethyl(34) synthesis GTPase MnmE [Muribaculaceae bacterium]